MNVPLAYFENNKCSYCNMISRALYHACTYPAATQKICDSLMFISITIHVQIHVHTGIKFLATYVAIDIYV